MGWFCGCRVPAYRRTGRNYRWLRFRARRVPPPPAAHCRRGCGQGGVVCRPSSPGLVAAAIRPVLLILSRVSGRRLLQPRLHLRRQLRLMLLHLFVAHRLVPAGVGTQLGAVDRHMPQRDQTGGLTEPQYLHEQLRQHRQLAFAELADGTERRPVEPRHRHHVHPFSAGTGQSARGVNAVAIAIQQQHHQHAAMADRLTLSTLVVTHDRRQNPALRAQCLVRNAPDVTPEQTHAPIVAEATPDPRPTRPSSCSCTTVHPIPARIG